MTGHPLFNFPAFFQAALALRGMGHIVTNPAERSMALGLDPSDPEPQECFGLEEAMAYDLQAVMASGAVALLPGWRDSKGTCHELAVAKATGASVFEFDPTAPGLLRPTNLPEPVILWPIEHQAQPAEPEASES